MNSPRHHASRRPDAALRGLAAALGVVAACLIASAAAPPAQSAVVRVAPGDTLGAIAARHGTTVAALVRANRLADPHRIVAGTVLRLPASSRSAAGPGPARSAGRYRVRPGDTLGAIAARHGVAVAALVRANGLRDPNRLIAGRVLRIPSRGGTGAPPAAAPSAPSPRPPTRAAVGPMIDAAAARHGVDPALARAVAWQESGWNQAAVSHAGALGVMQLMPLTAGWIATDILRRPVNPRSAADNIEAGVAYLAWLQRQTGDVSTALAAYYQGINSVRARGWFTDTRAYVRNVLALRGRV
jgi:N-acetylmuramoyl-L-alanine amidase